MALVAESHIVFVRKNASRGGNKETLPRSVFETPAFGGGFFLPRPPHPGRPPYPVGGDGLDRSFVHGATGSVELSWRSDKCLSNDSELMEMDEASG